jgi:hypothetical protein
MPCSGGICGGGNKVISWNKYECHGVPLITGPYQKYQNFGIFYGKNRVFDNKNRCPGRQRLNCNGFGNRLETGRRRRNVPVTILGSLSNVAIIGKGAGGIKVFADYFWPRMRALTTFYPLPTHDTLWTHQGVRFFSKQFNQIRTILNKDLPWHAPVTTH